MPNCRTAGADRLNTIYWDRRMKRIPALPFGAEIPSDIKCLRGNPVAWNGATEERLTVIEIDRVILDTKTYIGPLRVESEGVTIVTPMLYLPVSIKGEMVGFRSHPNQCMDCSVVRIRLSDGQVLHFGTSAVQGLQGNEQTLNEVLEAFVAHRLYQPVAQWTLDRIERHGLKKPDDLGKLLTESDQLRNEVAAMLRRLFAAFIPDYRVENKLQPLADLFREEQTVFFRGLRRAITLKQASQLAVGDTLMTWTPTARCATSSQNCSSIDPAPFVPMVGGGLTNGAITIPLTRPKKTDWASNRLILPLQVIREEQWPTLLRVLEGTFFDGFTEITALAKRVRNYQDPREHHERIRQIEHECFDGATFNVENIFVGVGKRLLFSGTYMGKPVYVVDGVYGIALYLFHDVESARRWANGEIRFEEARALAKYFTPHTLGWQERTRRRLATGPRSPIVTTT